MDLAGVLNGENSSTITFKTVQSRFVYSRRDVLLTRHSHRLRRVYILFHAKHGLNEVDRMMLSSLDEQCQASAGLKFTVQGIITKVDTLRDSELSKAIKSIQKDIFDAAPTCLPPIITSALEQPHYGVDQVRQSILEACGLGKAETKVYRPP